MLHLAYRTSKNDKEVGSTLPTEEELLLHMLESKGFTAVTTDRCRYARSVVKLFGGLDELIV